MKKLVVSSASLLAMALCLSGCFFPGRFHGNDRGPYVGGGPGYAQPGPGPGYHNY
jgi:hypothetical protein